jgi:hypothetical protein
MLQHIPSSNLIKPAGGYPSIQDGFSGGIINTPKMMGIPQNSEN